MSSSLSRRQVRRRILLWLGVSGVAVAIAVWSALDCHVGESRSQVAAPLRGVVYRGCAYVIREGACVLATDRVLTLFLPDTQSSRLQVRADGGLVTTTHTDLRDGIRISLRVPEDAKSVSLETDTGRFALRIAELPRQAALETLLALRSQGKLEELRARALALGTEAGSALDALALGVVARTWRDQGDVERTVRELRASQAAADRAWGVASAALWDGLALAHILRVDLWRFDEARQALARLARWLPECPHLRGEVAFARAIWERDTGNLRGALGPLRDAETHARRLGQTWMMI